MSDLDALHQQKILNRQYPPVQRTPEGATILEITGAGAMPEGTSEAPQGSAMPKADGQMDEVQLRADPSFLQDVGAIHQAFTGKPFEGDPAQLADWGIEKLANFELAMGDMTNPTGDAAGGGMVGQAAQILNNFTPEQSGSFLRALESYDKLPMFTMPGFGRLVRNVVADPTSIVGAATVGAGLVGRQAGRAAAKEGIKTALRQRVGQAILANPVKVGAGEAAAYTGTADAIRQNVEMKGGTRQTFDPLQTAGATAIGAAAGATLMKGAQKAGQLLAKIKSNIASNPDFFKSPGKVAGQRGAVGDLSQQKVFEIVSQAEQEKWSAEKILATFKKLGVDLDPAKDAPVEVFKPTAAAMGKAQKELHSMFPQEFADKADMNAPTQMTFAKGMYKDADKVGASFDARLDEAGLKFRKWAADNQNQTAIHANQKTGNSIDFSTSCANRSCGSGACAYCYVEHVRTQKAEGLGAMMSPKKVVENDYQGEVMRMPPSLINAYNMDGGVRMFAFGDFRPNVDDDNVARLLTDAQKRGLFIKAITKEPELIKRFGNHPNLRINFSIDNVPRDISHAATLDEAGKLKEQYPNLRIRSVALNAAEAEMYAKDMRVDVVTLYHGATNFKIDRTTGSPTQGQKIRTDKLYEIVKRQNPQIVEKMGEQKFKAWLDTWEDNSPKTKFAQEFQSKYEGRVCCQSGKCAGDPTKCGFGEKVAAKGGVALLILGGSHTIFLGEVDDNQVMWQ